MKRPPRPLFNLMLLLTFFVVLTYRALLRRGFSPFDLDSRRFRLSLTPPRPVFNSTILRFAETDLGEPKFNKDTDELLNGKKTGYFQYRTFATWYRVNGRLPLSRTARERHATIQATINPYWVEFRRNLQLWNQTRRFQDDIMLDLVKLVKHPLDRHRQQLPVSDKRYSSCAVVGNSGILLESNYGDLIDSHEIVIRLNNAKTDGYRSRVGSKTSISFVNSNILHLCARKPGCFCHPYGGNVPIVMYVCQAIHFLDHAICNSTHKSPLLITDHRFDILCSRIVKYYSSKRFMEVTGKSLEDWNVVHDGPNFHYSSGMQAIILALGTCDKVSVFGFGKSNSTKHHYHTNQKGELHLHDYEAEYELYRDIIERPRSVPFVSDKFEFPPMEIYH